MNDNVFKNALVMLITFKSFEILDFSASLLVPLAGGLFIFPFFLFSSLAGEIADQYPRHLLIKRVKLFEFLVMGLGTLGIVLESLAILFIALFMMGLQSTLFGPLKYGSLPSLVSSKKLVFSNAIVSAGTFIAILIGTILGGALSSLQSYKETISATILFMALLGYVSSLFLGRFDSHKKTLKEVNFNVFSSTFKMMGKVFKLGEEKWMIIGMSWFWFVGSVLLTIVPLIVKEVLYGDTLVATIFLALFTIGMGLGALASDRFSKPNSEIGLVPISCFLMSLFFFDLSFCIGKGLETAPFELMDIELFYRFFINWRVSFDLFAISFCGGLFMIPQMARLQEIAPASHLSRLIAANNIFNALFMVAAALFVMLFSSFGYHFIFFITGASCFVASWIFYQRYSVFSIRLQMKWISHLLYRIETSGFDKIPKEGKVIILSNHQSFADWLVLMGALPRPIQFVIDWSYYYLKGLHFWLKQAKLIPIATRREKVEILEEAFQKIAQELESGACIGIFPEGKLTRDGHMNKFQPGILKVLKQTPCPVVLLKIDGLWGSILSHSDGRVFFKIPKTFRRRVSLDVLKVYEEGTFNLKEAQSIMRGDNGV